MLSKAYLPRRLAQFNVSGSLATNQIAQADGTEMNRRLRAQRAVVFQTARFLRNRQSDTDGQTFARNRTTKTNMTFGEEPRWAYWPTETTQALAGESSGLQLNSANPG